MAWLKKLIMSILSVIGLMTVVVVLVSLYMAHKYLLEGEKGEKLTKSSILVVKLGDKPLGEGGKNRPLDILLSGQQRSVGELVTLIHQAKKDPRIKGLLLKADGSSIALAYVQELREAIEAFKQSQKPVYAYSDTMGEGGNGTGIYYLASCAHEIWLQPRGSLNLTGMILESYFLKGLLEDYKVKPQFDRREGYKGIIETYTQKEFTPETRGNLKSLLDDLMDQMITDAAKDRHMEKDQFKKMVDEGPYTDAQAQKLKLVDHLGHYDELKKSIEDKQGTSLSFVSDRYYAREDSEAKSGPKIALIHVDGAIYGSVNPMGEEESTSPRSIAKLLDKSLKDDEIKAVVLRINSPGGTVSAAETIWHEVKKIRDGKKPIIVSMGPTAASAGYQIAAPATKIVANPATLTGSIGVASGKVDLNGIFEHFHVHWDHIKSGDNAGMWSMTEGFSPHGWQKLQQSLDYYYDDFLTKVADGRKMDKTAVRHVAQGQVWSGRQAKERHLVDELGGLTTAIEVAKKELGLERDAPVQIITMSSRGMFLEGLLSMVNEQMVKMVWGQVKENIPLTPIALQSMPLYVRN